MKDLLATVKENIQIAENVYSVTLSLPESAGEIKGGQFADISVGSGEFLLRRPLGIVKAEDNEITLCYQIKGDGTKKLAETGKGAKLKILLPLGNGFDLSGKKCVAVIGGGVGIFPLIAAIRTNPDVKFYSYIGFRNKAAVCLLNELKASKKLTVTSDDGSFMQKGNAVQAFFDDKEKPIFDAIISCGPVHMLKALKRELELSGLNIPCYVSLEERMGCGLGACLVCVCGKTDGGNARVCKDGPVFDIRTVTL